MDARALLEQRRNMFITKRRDIEVWVANFFKEVKQINPSLLEGIEPPKGTTAQELFPSMYKEPFSQEEFDAEYAVVNDYYMKIQGVAEALNKRAEEVLNGASAY